MEARFMVKLGAEPLVLQKMNPKIMSVGAYIGYQAHLYSP